MLEKSSHFQYFLAIFVESGKLKLPCIISTVFVKPKQLFKTLAIDKNYACHIEYDTSGSVGDDVFSDIRKCFYVFSNKREETT